MRSSKSRISKSLNNRKLSKKSGGARKKRPLNKYFKAMLSAKKQNLSSFNYNGKKYKGTMHKHLGMIYKKQ